MHYNWHINNEYFINTSSYNVEIQSQYWGRGTERERKVDHIYNISRSWSLSALCLSSVSELDVASEWLSLLADTRGVGGQAAFLQENSQFINHRERDGHSTPGDCQQFFLNILNRDFCYQIFQNYFVILWIFKITFLERKNTFYFYQSHYVI